MNYLCKQSLGDPGYGTAIECVGRLIRETLGLQYGMNLPSGMEKTPERMVKAWQEMFAGYDMDPEKILLEATFDDPETVEYTGMVIVKDIPFYSFCEHHVLPFHGTADIGYIPDKRVVGLSKLPRLLDCYAKRFQVQERLNWQIVNAIMEILKPKGAMVTIRAEHLCMCARGVRKPGAITITSLPAGVFMTEAKAREEFLMLK